MNKFFVIYVIIVSSSIVLIESRGLDLPLSGGCQGVNSKCISGTQCCSGYCFWKKCCRSSGEQALTPSECCFSFTTNTNGFQCCSQHAQPCKEDKDCCPGQGKCSETTSTAKLCI